MKNILILISFLLICIVSYNCNENIKENIADNINLSLSLESNRVFKDSSNIMTVNIMNISSNKVLVFENDLKLKLTSSFTGNTKTKLISNIEDKIVDEEKSDMKLELEGGQSISHSIDLNKIIYTNDDIITGGEYSVMIVLETPKESEKKQGEDYIKSNVIEVEVM